MAGFALPVLILLNAFFSALTLARDHKLPINVFNINQPDAVRDIISGKKIGTLIN